MVRIGHVPCRTRFRGSRVGHAHVQACGGAPDGASHPTDIRARGLNDRAKFITASAGTTWREPPLPSCRVPSCPCRTWPQAAPWSCSWHRNPAPRLGWRSATVPPRRGGHPALSPCPASALHGRSKKTRPPSSWGTLNLNDLGVEFGWRGDLARLRGPVEVTETTDLLARSVLGADTSAVVSHRILKVDHAWQLSLETPPDNQYAAGGDQALIDGLQGGDDFRRANGKATGAKNASPPWIRTTESVTALRSVRCRTSSLGFGRPSACCSPPPKMDGTSTSCPSTNQNSPKTTKKSKSSGLSATFPSTRAI